MENLPVVVVSESYPNQWQALVEGEYEPGSRRGWGNTCLDALVDFLENDERREFIIKFQD